MADEKEQEIGTKPRFPDLLPAILVPFGLLLLCVCLFQPTLIPYQHLGPVGDFLNYMAVSQQMILWGLFWFATICHCSEAIYAVVLARKYNLSLVDTFLWFLLVLVYGLFCLLSFKPSKPKVT